MYFTLHLLLVIYHEFSCAFPGHIVGLFARSFRKQLLFYGPQVFELESVDNDASLPTSTSLISSCVNVSLHCCYCLYSLF